MQFIHFIKNKFGYQAYFLLGGLLAVVLGALVLLAEGVLAKSNPPSWERFGYLLPSQAGESLNSELTIPEEEFLPSMVPVSMEHGWVSDEFGIRKRHPISGRKNVKHSGIDLAVYTGTPVMAAADGAITFSGRNRGYGLTVKIDHLNGIETIYAHNSRLKVKKGDYVRKGDVIALSGNTGVSTGAHLHYEIRVEGKPINPRKSMAGLPPKK